MRLSKIRLSGFKSFVDPTVVQFPGNLMGVVGPNGCGKSNIIDAIRWVLGESSAKTLRGDSMADVIFNGSSGRKPVGQASVELTFDNADGRAGGAYASYAEISVRRVVTREGVSQYFLNNTRCRRKDITQILLGTGLGSHGYSIIEQGMISRLVEAKPEELRAFIEEAAGISKYKERRRETEHRIRHTRENLERLEDLREEVDKQISHLKRQARAAERYKDLKAEMRQRTAELLALRLTGLRKDVVEREDQVKRRQLDLDGAIAGQRKVEAAIEHLRVRQGETTEAFNATQGDYYRVGAEIARLEQVIKHRRETIRTQSEDLNAATQQLAEIVGHIENDQVEIAQLEQLLGELNPELEDAQSKQRSAEELLASVERELETWRERRDQISQAIADVSRTVHVEETRLEQLSTHDKRLESQEGQRRAELEAIDFRSLENRVDCLIVNEEQLRLACSESNRALDSVSNQLVACKGDEEALQVQLDSTRASLQSARGRLASLEALQEAAFGKAGANASAWLESNELAQSPRLGESLVVDSGWERAVEMVLGSYLQAVEVDGLDRLADRIGTLSGSGASFLAQRSSVAAVCSDAVSLLASRVKAPLSAHALLRGVRTATDLAAAFSMLNGLGMGESVVTPDGFWLARDWLRISAEDDPRMGVIARAEEIDQLRQKVRATTRSIEQMQAQLNDTRRRLDALEVERIASQREANRRQQMYAEVSTRLSTCRNELRQCHARSKAVEGLLNGILDERAGLTAAAEACRRTLEESNIERKRLVGIGAEWEAKRESIQSRLAELRTDAESSREMAQSIAIQVESRRSSKESASAALARVKVQQQHLTARQLELREKIDSEAAPLQEDESKLAELLEEHRSTEGRLGEARTALESVDAELRAAEQERNEHGQIVLEAREAVDGDRLELREAQVRAETVAEQFAETGYEFETTVAELPDDADVGTWTEAIEKIDRRIQRLGPINLAAIEEYKEQLERKEYLDSQFEDLTEALSTLEGAIRKIDRETRAKFRETFDRANQGVGQIFPRLFGGGSAHLELDSDDLLSCGVAIMARPPGKRISTIHLLSGGEKALTAVALVFSIFQLNPAPFCLLDEVDAPLDEANVGRFSAILREMSDQVQFVIITHNKTTMESMGQLTGVTMNEPGVSRMVAVDIEEAVQLAAM